MSSSFLYHCPKFAAPFPSAASLLIFQPSQASLLIVLFAVVTKPPPSKILAQPLCKLLALSPQVLVAFFFCRQLSAFLSPKLSLVWLLLIPSFRRCFFFSPLKTPVAFFFPFDVLLSLPPDPPLRLLCSYLLYGTQGS